MLSCEAGLGQAWTPGCSSRDGHNFQESPEVVSQLELGEACFLLLTFQFSKAKDFLTPDVCFLFHRTTFVLHSRRLPAAVRERLC